MKIKISFLSGTHPGFYSVVDVSENESIVPFPELVKTLMAEGLWLNTKHTDWVSPSAILRVWKVN